jgi:hypothetical protein
MLLPRGWRVDAEKALGSNSEITFKGSIRSAKERQKYLSARVVLEKQVISLSGLNR